MRKALIVVPTYLSQPSDLEVHLVMLESLRRTEPDVEVQLVDDGSPAQALVDELEAASPRFDAQFHRKEVNEGFSRTVNVGLRRALQEGKHAVLVNADVEFIDKGWLAVMAAQEREDGQGRAAIVGARLLYPNGLIQHAGVFFSLLHRCFEHIYKYAPADLPEAQFARRCPVTAALMFIRHETLKHVGLFDEEFRLGWEDVDYCIRTFLAGGDCVMQPKVRAFHHESMFRGRPNPKIADWQRKSWLYFVEKYRTQSFAEWVPSVA